uniref:Uncharacterized protein n=1 Tax=Manihot esculenta TaxID=3983 RepID=A0A2C9V5M2_MANES
MITTAFPNGTWSNWYQVIFLRQRQLKCENWALYLLFWHRRDSFSQDLRL